VTLPTGFAAPVDVVPDEQSRNKQPLIIIQRIEDVRMVTFGPQFKNASVNCIRNYFINGIPVHLIYRTLADDQCLHLPYFLLLYCLKIGIDLAHGKDVKK
jgi:hypothetical protein